MRHNPKENAKNPRWQVPMDLPNVKPEDYVSDKGQPENTASRRSGTQGFAPQLSGQSMQDHSNTASFDAGVLPERKKDKSE